MSSRVINYCLNTARSHCPPLLHNTALLPLKYLSLTHSCFKHLKSPSSAVIIKKTQICSLLHVIVNILDLLLTSHCPQITQPVLYYMSYITNCNQQGRNVICGGVYKIYSVNSMLTMSRTVHKITKAFENILAFPTWKC